MDEQQEKKEIDCFFLMMEVVSGESGDEKENTEEPESMFGGATHGRLHNDAEVHMHMHMSHVHMCMHMHMHMCMSM